MKLIFLTVARRGSEWDACLNDLLTENPELDTFDQEQFQTLFDSWLQFGDRKRLIGELEKHPSWQQYGWRILAEEYARRGDFKAAYEMAEKHQPRVRTSVGKSSRSLETLRRAFVLNPSDPVPGVELYFSLRTAGALDEAVYTLKRVAELPSAPLFVKRELAAIAAEKGDFRGAWELLARSIDHAKR
jgi:hypothetical protein